MSEVKIFRVTGKMAKPNFKTNFKKEVRATKPENAREKILMELGSKHRAKRFQIKIFKIEEIPPGEAESLLIRKMMQERKKDGVE